MDIHERLGVLIQERAGGNDSEVARRMGVDPHWVNNRVLGKRKMKVEELPAFAEVFDMDVCELACRLLKDQDDTVEDIRRSMAGSMMRMQRQAGAPSAETLLNAIRDLLREYDSDAHRA